VRRSLRTSAKPASVTQAATPVGVADAAVQTAADATVAVVVAQTAADATVAVVAAQTAVDVAVLAEDATVAVETAAVVDAVATARPQELRQEQMERLVLPARELRHPDLLPQATALPAPSATATVAAPAALRVARQRRLPRPNRSAGLGPWHFL